jgi:signal transduction histidine kinase
LDVFQDEMKSVFTVEQQALLQKMTVSAEMLSLYVNNILNVAKVDQQIMPLHIIEADWREVLKEAYADLFLRAKAHGRILKLELPATLPPAAIDRISMIEVINNLVDNAIKYSSEGGEITIRAEEHEGLISTAVVDHGIGIPDAILGNLFKKFYRSHTSRTGVSGTGLGLYLSKAIIDAHGGNIWVRSQAGKGSTFGFDLPTYASVADTLKKGDNNSASIRRSSKGWIKNHAMYRPAQDAQDKSTDAQ